MMNIGIDLRFSAAMRVSALLACCLPLTLWGSDLKSQWNNVAHVTHGGTYIVAEHDHSCIGGNIKQVDESAITVVPANGPAATLPQTAVLRVTDGAWAPAVIFSTRSSWLDVANLVGKHFHPQIAIRTINGQQHEGKLVGADDTALQVQVSGKLVRIGKTDVSRVDYLRAPPLSSSAAYADDELAWMKIFDPQLWPRIFHLQPLLSVRLFDRFLPEDDSPIVCTNDPQLPNLRPRNLTQAPYPPQPR